MIPLGTIGAWRWGMSGQQRRSLLVIDDDWVLVRTIGRVLATAYEVTCVTTPGDALQKLSARPFDIVLCDISLTERDGLTLGDELVRLDPRYFGAILFMSGAVPNREQIARMKRQEQRFLLKPFTPEELMAAMTAVLDPRQRTQAA